MKEQERFLYTVDEAAASISMSVSWMRKALSRREFTPIKVGTATRVSVSEIQEYIAKKKASIAGKTAGVPQVSADHQEIRVSDKSLILNGEEQW